MFLPVEKARFCKGFLTAIKTALLIPTPTSRIRQIAKESLGIPFETPIDEYRRDAVRKLEQVRTAQLIEHCTASIGRLVLDIRLRR